MIKLYVSHSRKFDYIKNLYRPIKNSSLNDSFEIILPHQFSDKEYPSNKLFKENVGSIFVLSDISIMKSDGRDTELTWAHNEYIPIISFYKKDSKYSKFAKSISDVCFEYKSINDMILQLESTNFLGLLNSYKKKY